MQKYHNNNYELEEYEKELLKALNKAGYKSVPNLKREMARYRAIAKATLTKKRNINIRISESDLLKIKAKAARKGLPYQTMITSLIHQYSTGQIKD